MRWFGAVQLVSSCSYIAACSGLQSLRRQEPISNRYSLGCLLVLQLLAFVPWLSPSPPLAPLQSAIGGPLCGWLMGQLLEKALGPNFDPASLLQPQLLEVTLLVMNIMFGTFKPAVPVGLALGVAAAGIVFQQWQILASPARLLKPNTRMVVKLEPSVQILAQVYPAVRSLHMLVCCVVGASILPGTMEHVGVAATWLWGLTSALLLSVFPQVIVAEVTLQQALAVSKASAAKDEAAKQASPAALPADISRGAPAAAAAPNPTMTRLAGSQIQEAYSSREGFVAGDIARSLEALASVASATGSPLKTVLQELRYELSKGSGDLETAVRKVEPLASPSAASPSVPEVTTWQDVVEALREHAGEIAHDLKNPLNGVLALSQTVMQGTFGEIPKAAQDQLGVVRACAYQLLNMVCQLKDMMQGLHQGDLGSAADHCAVTDHVNEVLDRLRPMINKNLVATNQTQPTHMLLADAEKLYQVLHAMLANALKYTRRGTVVVETEMSADGRYCTVKATDTGGGFTEAQLHKFNSPLSGSEEDEMGLGLMLVKRMMAAWGGRLKVSPNNPAPGSCVELVFRATADAPSLAQIKPREKPAPSRVATRGYLNHATPTAPGTPSAAYASMNGIARGSSDSTNGPKNWQGGADAAAASPDTCLPARASSAALGADPYSSNTSSPLGPSRRNSLQLPSPTHGCMLTTSRRNSISLLSPKHVTISPSHSTAELHTFAARQVSPSSPGVRRHGSSSRRNSCSNVALPGHLSCGHSPSAADRRSRRASASNTLSQVSCALVSMPSTSYRPDHLSRLAQGGWTKELLQRHYDLEAAGMSASREFDSGSERDGDNSLSRRRQQSHAGEVAAPYTNPHAGATILVADDDGVNLKIIEDLLVANGYEVLTAGSGNEALEVFVSSDQPVKLVLLDVSLPDMKGTEVCEKMRGLCPGVPPPIIMISGRSGIEDVVAGLQAGSSDYITKPFRSAELLARVDTQLRVYMGEVQSMKDDATRNMLLMSQILPPHILRSLEGGSRIMVEKYNDVYVLHAEIVNFGTLLSHSDGIDCITAINHMYTIFDQLMDKYDVQKVECLGNTYCAAIGHTPQDARYTSLGQLQNMICCGREMLEVARDMAYPEALGKMELRVGLHVGPLTAGVLGVKYPRFSFFGTTQRLSVALMHNALPMTMHVSEAVYKRAQKLGELDEYVPFTLSSFPGLGIIRTYLLMLGSGDLSHMSGVNIPDYLARVNTRDSESLQVMQGLLCDTMSNSQASRNNSAIVARRSVLSSGDSRSLKRTSSINSRSPLFNSMKVPASSRMYRETDELHGLDDELLVLAGYSPKVSDRETDMFEPELATLTRTQSMPTDAQGLSWSNAGSRMTNPGSSRHTSGANALSDGHAMRGRSLAGHEKAVSAPPLPAIRMATSRSIKNNSVFASNWNADSDEMLLHSLRMSGSMSELQSAYQTNTDGPPSSRSLGGDKVVAGMRVSRTSMRVSFSGRDQTLEQPAAPTPPAPMLGRLPAVLRSSLRRSQLSDTSLLSEVVFEHGEGQADAPNSPPALQMHDNVMFEVDQVDSHRSVHDNGVFELHDSEEGVGEVTAAVTNNTGSEEELLTWAVPPSQQGDSTVQDLEPTPRSSSLVRTGSAGSSPLAREHLTPRSSYVVDTSSVDAFLRSLGLSHYSQSLGSQVQSVEQLLKLTSSELRAAGVVTEQARQRIMMRTQEPEPAMSRISSLRSSAGRADPHLAGSSPARTAAQPSFDKPQERKGVLPSTLCNQSI